MDAGLASLAERNYAPLRRLIEPPPSIVGFEARRRARYTSLLLVILVPMGVFALILTAMFPRASASRFGVEFWALFGAVALLAALYPVSQSRRFVVASYGAIVVSSLAIWWVWTTGVPRAESITTLYWLVIPIFMAGPLLGANDATMFVGTSLFTVVVGIALFTPGLILTATAATLVFFLLAVAGLVVTLSVVRERDIAELERLTTRLREADQRRVQMLNNIAHDLGTPLTPVKILVSMLRPEHATAERVDMIQRNVAQVERLVVDLKDLARMEAKMFRLAPRLVDIRALARAGTASFQDEATRREVQLGCQDGEDVYLQGDPQRLLQVFYNLITNAIKFTPKGGSVRCEISVVGSEALVRVVDTGRGLTNDEVARLFQAFTQVHAHHEIVESGSGLGLYISRGIIEAHGGRLWVESDGRGRGSAFVVALPYEHQRLHSPAKE